MFSHNTRRAFNRSTSLSVVELTICARPQGKLSLGHVVTQKKNSDAEFNNGSKGLRKGKKLFLNAQTFLMRRRQLFNAKNKRWVVIVSAPPKILENYCFQSTCRVTSILLMCKLLCTQKPSSTSLDTRISIFIILIHLFDAHGGLSTLNIAKL